MQHNSQRIQPTILVVMLLFSSITIAQQPAAFEWPTATPQSQGMSGAKIEAMSKALAARKTKALLIIRNDKIVHEWYSPDHGASNRHYSASMAKAAVGGVSLAVAISDGRISLDDPAAKYIPQWKADPRKSKITIRQLGSHTAGLEDAEVEGVTHEKLTGWKGDFWKRLDPPNDPFTISRDRAPILFDPGSRFDYSNPGIAMMTYAVTASLKDAPHKDIRTLLRERIMRPIGAGDQDWTLGYGRSIYSVDGLPLVPSWGGGNFTARAAARVGRLMLREGDWDGKRLLSADAVRQVTTDAGTPGNCGIGWWSNNQGRYEKLPKDAYWGSGAGHQILLVIPSLKLIVVRNGDVLGPTRREPAFYHEPVRQFLFEPLIDAITQAPPAGAAAPPYPPSPLIAQIEWAPKETILRSARGCDNFPITWADDDHLYTAYGDGNGFAPHLKEKLSLGLARIEGGPLNFAAFNIRAPTLEQKGEGKAGKKASGLLMVDGILYMWVRNAANSQLAWSADHGRTWTWADWKFTTSFACPTFLNFGQNYAGARDNFVYIYSHDADSAYEPADRMVLARVDKARIRQRGAYEFLQLVTRDATVWSTDIAQRCAVFTHKGKCYRSGISYNAALKRYLWCHSLPAPGDVQDARFAGGLAIHDAPQPWGPWTTAFYSESWDVGPGETSSFPTRWMSADGKTLYLVFSGDDSFSVRKATITTHQ